MRFLDLVGRLGRLSEEPLRQLALPRELALPLDYGSSSDVGAVASTPHVVWRGSGIGLRASAMCTRTRRVLGSPP